MDAIPFAYGLAAVSVTLVAWFAPEPHCRDCRIFSHILMLMWALANLAPCFAPDPNSLLMYPAMDLAALIAILIIWFLRPCPWKAAASLLLVLNLGIHGTFWVVHDLSNAAQSAYQLRTNLVFAALLLCPVWPVAANVVRRRVLHLWHRRAGASRLAK